MRRSISYYIPLATLGLLAFLLQQFPLPIWFPTEDVQADVIYLGTPEKVVDEMLRLAQVGHQDKLYDLGSGDGRIVITAAQRWGAQGIGVEIDPDLVQLSRENAIKANVADRVKFVEKDLFKLDFRDASVVTLYLMPELNLRLRPTFLNDLRPGTRIVSHRWDMGEWQPDEVSQVVLGRSWFSSEKVKQSTLFSWVVPANISGIWQWGGSEAAESLSLKIVQQFQRAEGLLSDKNGEHPAAIELRGDYVCVESETRRNGKLVPVVFEGRVHGEKIEGVAHYGQAGESEIRAWKAFRQSGTMAALDR